MRGLILLFLVVVFSIVGWGYCSNESQKEAIKLVRRHLLAFIIATAAVAVAIVLSVNTTLRLV